MPVILRLSSVDRPPAPHVPRPSLAHDAAHWNACVAVLTDETTGDLAREAVVDRYDDRGAVELITVPTFTPHYGFG